MRCIVSRTFLSEYLNIAEQPQPSTDDPFPVGNCAAKSPREAMSTIMSDEEEISSSEI